ncbi:MAG: FAD-dependent oxidoreductase [Cytophagales bacterium]|nr:FAD-dependent oxidoreductase [Cytophagales bacterium]
MGQDVDYILVGQGLAGSALAWELLSRGKKILVYDEPSMNRASGVSAGICNPITGKAMVKTYLAETLFPSLSTFYAAAEKQLHTTFFHPLPVIRPFISQEEMGQWKIRAQSEELHAFVSRVHEGSIFSEFIHDPYGSLQIAQAGYLDVPGWLRAVRNHLAEQGFLFMEHFLTEELEAGEIIRYRGHTAKKIIFCDGLSSRKGSWFEWLPIRPLKGETLTVQLAMDARQIFSRGVYLVPTGAKQTFIVGSTYEHMPFEEGPTEEGRSYLESRLRALVKPPFEVIHQSWGIRPTVSDRRPLLGLHPANNNVAVFNGLGTKGVSLAPYFALRLADWLDQRQELPVEVNILRFKSLYSG